MRKYKYVCNECGSDRVIFDSWTEWDAKEQKFIVYDVFEDDAFCIQCDGPISSGYKMVNIDE